MATISSTLTRPQTDLCNSQLENSVSTGSNNKTPMQTKSVYQADQQAKFLNLQAEIDSLLQQLQTLKQARTALSEETTANSSDRSDCLE